MADHKIRQGGRGIYVLPSLFTTAGLFAGFYALIAALQGRFELAAWALVAAAIFDVLDGRIARLMHAESSFGAEYDSLCDMVSFGIAPAVLVYLWVLTPLHKPGWLAAFLIAACAALRLARFNVQANASDKRYFQGLPTPAMAMLSATAVMFYADHDLQPRAWPWFFVALSLAFLMVSRVRFISAKDVDLKKRRPFVVVIAILFFLVLIVSNPHTVLFTMALAYCLHGPLLSIWQRHRAVNMRLRRAAQQKKSDAD